MKVGDLVRDNSDGDLGLVTSEVCSYDIVEGPTVEFVWVKWSLFRKPQRMSMSAIEKGWVEVINESRRSS